MAGIYGANASGKSNVLNALDFMCRAVMYSATRWGSDATFPHTPFSLNATSAVRASTYEVDVVVEGVRHTYGFESRSSGVVSEWLFERDTGHAPEMRFGRSLPGENATISKLLRPDALFLSVAANNNHPVLTQIHEVFRSHFKYARSTENDKLERLRLVRELSKDEEVARQAHALLQFADLGIVGMATDEEDMPKEVRNTLEPEHQSAGTVAWLSFGVPALVSLRNGDVFLVDEIGSSLHPRLTAALIQLFKDPQINTSGAQLVFTSHDSALLGKMLGSVLDADEVWFTEKHRHGSTELYALQEFHTRRGDNAELRYLQGRYGAVPIR